MRILIAALVLSAIHTAALADWKLVQPSAIHFVSIKNNQVAETHRFKTFEGNISDQGDAQIRIDLASVDTGIGIRDERMREFLFQTDQFGTAEFRATLAAELLASVASKGPVHRQLTGTLSLHGRQLEVTGLVAIQSGGDGVFTVSTVAPMLVKAADYQLVEGINKLRELAGLDAIASVVPVTFGLTFSRE